MPLVQDCGTTRHGRIRILRRTEGHLGVQLL